MNAYEYKIMFQNCNAAHMYRDDEEPTSDEPETVQLIAAGYEWFCPPCDHVNKTIEITESVTCEICGREYRTDDETLHAYG